MNMQAVARRTAGSAELYFRRNGPSILMAAGVTGFVATAYLAGRAAIKAQRPVFDLKKKHAEVADRELSANYTRKDQGRELAQVWIKYGTEIAKIYAPAIITGSASIICVVSSHGMLKNQKAALAAAYAALDAGYKAYRSRVREEVGEEKELELYRGVRMIQREPAEGDEEGALMPCEIDYSDRHPSPYAKFFDPSNPNWSKTPENNLFFCKQVEHWANEQLQANGFLFLNEVYRDLGIPRTQAGQAVGWRLDAEANGTGDGYVDFGIYDIADESSRAFVNGYEGTILLDFNVDGPINI